MQAVAQKSFAQRAVNVCASLEQQSRQVLSGVFAAGVATLIAAQSASALSPVDVFDDRKVRSEGFDLIYEARDGDLPQAQRDGLSQARGSLDTTKLRVREAESRIDSALQPVIEKAYWTEAREQLRRQVGTLRFDLNTLSDIKPKAEKKEAQALKKEFIAKVEALDFALRQKDKESALPALEAAKASLDAVLAAVL